MAKPYAPIKLNLEQALEAVNSFGDKYDRLQSVSFGIEAQFVPSEDKKLNIDFIEKLYGAGGFFKSISHMTELEQDLYLDANTLLQNPQFVDLLNRWNESDLTSAEANKQRITKDLRQSISTANQNRLTEVFRLLAPVTLRQKSAGSKGGKLPKEGYLEKVQETKAKAQSLLASNSPHEVASKIAKIQNVHSRTIRNRMKK